MELISIKSPHEIQCMRRAGRVTAQARALAGSMVRPGITTLEIDHAVRRFIESHGGKPSFLGYAGYPGSACISVNDEVIHGIPSKKTVLREGDIVSVDVGAYVDGFHGDCAATYPCGQVSDEALRLIAVTQQSFWEGMKFARVGYRVSDISHAVQEYAEENGFSLVRKVFHVEHANLTVYCEDLGESLGEALLTPTRIYVKPVLAAIDAAEVHGISHITGGGFYENIPRCLPDGMTVKIEKAAVRTPPIFKMLRETGHIPERDMFNTFNMGVGMAVIVSRDTADQALSALAQHGCPGYVIGEVISGEERVILC